MYSEYKKKQLKIKYFTKLLNKYNSIVLQGI